MDKPVPDAPADATHSQVNLDIDDQGSKSAVEQPSVTTKLRRTSGDDNDRLVARNPEDEDVGCCGRSGEGFRSYWSTRELEMMDGGRERYIRTTLIELLIYIVFLTFLSIVTFCMINPAVYYYTTILSGLFTETPISSKNDNTFRQISTHSDFWEFLNQSLVENLFWEITYYGRNLTDEELGYIFYENKLQGVARLRQVKVSNNSCKVQEDFKNIITSCYNIYSTANEFKEPFGAHNVVFTYQTDDQLKGSSHWGIISTYDGGGYVQDLTQIKETSRELINQLFVGQWIDRGTRAVFIDFTVYNANINLFCVVRLVAEFPATGGIITSSTFYTVKLLRYVSTMDYVVMTCEIIVCVFVLYYIVEEIMEMVSLKVVYFVRFWNYIDLIIIIIALCCIAFNVYRTVTVNSMLDDLLKDPNKYPDFEFLAYWQVVFNSALAVMVFFAWVKVFKYLSFNKTMTQLSSTLSRCAKDLVGFAVMFFIIFLAFAQLGYLIFGTQAKGFSTFPDSIFTLFRIILGDFDFSALEEANRVLGPIFFILYVFFVFFVLLNMFLAIINDTYAQVKANLDKQNMGFHTTDYIKLCFYRFLDKLNIKHAASTAADRPKDCRTWEQDMIAQGFAPEHVTAVVSKYCDIDTLLTKTDQKEMEQYLEEMSKGYFYGVEGTDQTNTVEARLENMQKNFSGMASKIEDAIIRFKRSEKQKAQRMAAMSKLLDAIVEAQSSSDERKLNQIHMMVKEELERIT